MAATMRQFMQEVSPLLKFHYQQNRASRAGYKAAVEALAVRKMPKANELERRGFVLFALKVYDLMQASGLDPLASPEDIGMTLEQAKRANVGQDAGDWQTVGKFSVGIN